MPYLGGGEVMEVEEATVKRARAEEGEAAGGEVVANGISTVIPGWFSEISPMWPGTFLFFIFC
jgi:hypothetical protein